MELSVLSQAYALRVYAGWLGKCIGVRLGAPLEGRPTQDLKEITDYLPLPAGTLFGPEDDTSLALILARSVKDYGPDATTFQIGKTWLNYLGDQHGTFRWDGYGVSADHTAYCNLSANIAAPESGAAVLNGAALAEQVGGQTCNDFWGLLVPDNPKLAASYAECAASVAYDGEGLYGARFVAALVSAAFGETDPRKLVATALAVIPEESTYARTIRALLEFHTANPEDWRSAVQVVETLVGSQDEDTWLAVVPNGARVVLALLYGGGDFSRSVRIAASAGGQTGSNAGNVGMVLGVAAGIEGIPLCWREPLNDTLSAASLLGARNLTNISACADFLCSLGRQIAGEEEPVTTPRYHFTYPGATQGFLLRTKGAAASVRQAASAQGGMLEASI
ncbi:MAG: ADP-ribosylglycohydrolase family protein, partial [Anaerolineae bacterium]|nr:ADP-ribosylglycohydrolase family protein [Anaerolineae bacterium]